MATVVIQKHRLKKSHEIRYRVMYWDPVDCKKKHYRMYRKQREANQAANDLRALIDSGKIAELERRKAKIKLLRFSQVGNILQESWMKRLESGQLRRKTCDEYICRLKHLNKTFGRKLLCDISEEDILAYRSKVSSELSNVTSNRSLFIIKQVFKKGLEARGVLSDPCKKIQYLSEKGQQRNKFLLPDVLDKLVESSQTVRAKFYLPSLIYLGAEHGASKQESLCLEWEDINFEYEGKGMIRFFRTKNGRERTEYLMPRTKEALLRWRDHKAHMRRRRKITEVKSNLVFCRLDGTALIGFDKAWRGTCKAAGLKGFHFHDLRHTFCSNLILAGADLKNVKEMIGHSDLAMTDRYAHITLNQKQLWQDKLVEQYTNGQDSQARNG